MKAIGKSGNYLTFNINDIGYGTLYRLLREGLIISQTLSVDDQFEFKEMPLYVTQIPYASGYIQDRYIYTINDQLKPFLVQELSNDDNDSCGEFLSKFVCWDFYIDYLLIMSINLVMGIVIINTDILDLNKYDLQY